MSSIDVQSLNSLDNLDDYADESNGETLLSLQKKIAIVSSGRPRRRPGEWEEDYFQALVDGQTLESAGALAGVTRKTPWLRRKADPVFAEREWQAIQLGTAKLLQIAHDGVQKGRRGYERVLLHLLSHRGIKERRVTETTGPNGGPQQINVNGKSGGEGDFDFNSLPFTIEEKRQIVELVDRALARKAAMNVETPNDSVDGRLLVAPSNVYSRVAIGQDDAQVTRPLVRLPI